MPPKPKGPFVPRPEPVAGPALPVPQPTPAAHTYATSGTPSQDVKALRAPATDEDRERLAYIDKAAIEIYSRHFTIPKCFTQAAELWEARKAWLSGRWSK